MEKQNLSRRNAMKKMAGAAAIIGAPALHLGKVEEPLRLKGNINHSVCKWCYGDFSVEELAKEAVRMGIKSMEIIGPDDWATIKEYGLTCAMSNGPFGITNNVNRVENHAEMIPAYKKRINTSF